MAKPVNKDAGHRAKVANHDERFDAIWTAIDMVTWLMDDLNKRVRVLEGKAKPTQKKGK
jgi:hypothetical protein